jgi:membrane protease YdiL (CAAX protease family)
MLVLVACIVALSIYLVGGPQWIDNHLPQTWIGSTTNKILHHTGKEVVGGALLAFQFFLGNAAAPILQGKFTTNQLLLGLPLCFVWLVIEVGLVEEFFFRALVQSRLAAWFKSEVSGVVLMSLAFGLAHAP